MTLHTIITRYARREVHPDATFRDIGLDCIDRQCIACDIEEAFGCELPDEAIETWASVADVAATVAELGKGRVA